MGMTRGRAERIVAEEHGYFPLEDDRRGPGWYKFKKGHRWVWYCVEFWQTADLIDGYYRNHEKFDNLLSALERPL